MRARTVSCWGVLCALALGLSLWPVAAAEDQACEYREVRHQVQILNLVNFMYLSQDQMKQLLAVAQEAKQLQDDCEIKAAIAINQGLAEFKGLKDALLKGPEVPSKIVNAGTRVDHEVTQPRKDYDERLKELTQKAKAVLTENQVGVVAQYSACLVPPKRVTDPSHIGQAKPEVGPGQQLLIQARSWSQEEYAEKSEQVIEEWLPRIEKYLHAKLQDPEAQKERMRSVFLKARAMPEAEFNLRRAELSRELSPSHPATESPADWKIRNFLVTPDIIPILQYRIALKIEPG